MERYDQSVPRAHAASSMSVCLSASHDFRFMEKDWEEPTEPNQRSVHTINCKVCCPFTAPCWGRPRLRARFGSKYLKLTTIRHSTVYFYSDLIHPRWWSAHSVVDNSLPQQQPCGFIVYNPEKTRWSDSSTPALSGDGGDVLKWSNAAERWR